ncbi:hypothetical protein [Microtetraspora sp. NBRC 13810]|uniref:hypothetical protein n=1 Tax=Microtetraspora sp. NBRC 13810 TaxID=3030990 RepID=UPI00255226D1|nr:hypothetical protein [Microtetraspora sp. NBRC 13810]
MWSDPVRHHDRGRWLAEFAGRLLVAGRSAPADRSAVAHGRDDRPRAHSGMYFRGGPY